MFECDDNYEESLKKVKEEEEDNKEKDLDKSKKIDQLLKDIDTWELLNDRHLYLSKHLSTLTKFENNYTGRVQSVMESNRFKNAG